MEVYCTRPNCPRPLNSFADLDDSSLLKTVQQKYCTACGMPMILAGRYLPVRLLARGGFGAAFLARDRYTPAMRQCVVKLLQPAGNLNPQQLQIAQNLFEREAAVLEELGSEHPQIPNLLAFFELTVSSLQPGKQEKFFYLVQEFIDGQNLEEELAQKGEFSEAEVLEVLGEILKILEFIHDRGSIHRDIKPANIMRGRNGRLYLLDFGAVKQVTQVASGSQASTGIYSLGFAPPEQMSGQEVYPSTDLYALAVTCITLLAGKPPAELFDAFRNEWNWRSQVTVSDRTAQILDKMLLPAASQRFQSAAQVATVINARRQSQPKASQLTNQPPATSIQPTPRARFSSWEILAAAGFTGFEGGLLAIALTAVFPYLGVSFGLLGMILAGMIYGQYRGAIERTERLIISGVTLAIFWFFPTLQTAAAIVYPSLPFTGVLLVGAMAGLSAIALTALFLLIYKLLSNIF